MCIKENIACEVKKCFIPNNENTIYQNLQDVAKAVLQRKCIALNLT